MFWKSRIVWKYVVGCWGKVGAAEGTNIYQKEALPVLLPLLFQLCFALVLRPPSNKVPNELEAITQTLRATEKQVDQLTQQLADARHEFRQLERDLAESRAECSDLARRAAASALEHSEQTGATVREAEELARCLEDAKTEIERLSRLVAEAAAGKMAAEEGAESVFCGMEGLQPCCLRGGTFGRGDRRAESAKRNCSQGKSGEQ